MTRAWTPEIVEKVARAIWNASQDRIEGDLGTYPLKMKLSWDEAQRAAQAALNIPEIAALYDALDSCRFWFAGYIANGGQGADEELALVRKALGGNNPDTSGSKQ